MSIEIDTIETADDIVLKTWHDVIETIEYDRAPLSSEKTLVFLFMWEMANILDSPNLRFDFEFPAYSNLVGHEHLDLMVWTNENFKMAFEFKLPKSTFNDSKGYSNISHPTVKKNMYRDIARLYYLAHNNINGIKVGYFLCSTNEFPLINQLSSESPYRVHHGYVNHTIKEIDRIPFPCGVEFTWDLIGQSRFLRHHDGFIPKNRFGWLRPIRITEEAAILPNPTTGIILPDRVTAPASRER